MEVVVRSVRERAIKITMGHKDLVRLLQNHDVLPKYDSVRSNTQLRIEVQSMHVTTKKGICHDQDQRYHDLDRRRVHRAV